LLIHFVPPKIRATSILQTLSPAALTMVAGGSTSVPTIEISGRASMGNP